MKLRRGVGWQHNLLVDDTGLMRVIDGNPHAHILLTIRPLKPDGRWGPKCRKVYDLDSQGNRIPDGKGGWKNHREDTTDWNNRENAEKWRAAWATYANRGQFHGKGNFDFTGKLGIAGFLDFLYGVPKRRRGPLTLTGL